MTIKFFALAAALAVCSFTSANATEIRLCTGSSTGVYYDAGEVIKSSVGR